jgi:hypothetical protein
VFASVVPAPPGVVMVAPHEAPRNAERTQSEVRATGGHPKSAARGIIEAGAPAFGCTVHPLRLQAPRAAYAHKSPGQGDCTATPGWPGGRDGRKSIKSKIIDTKAADSAIVGNMPYLRWTASPAKNVSPGRARILYALQRRHGTRMYSISSSPSGNSTTCPRKCQPS